MIILIIAILNLCLLPPIFKDTLFLLCIFLMILFPNIAFFFFTQMLAILYENNSDSGCYILPESIQPILEGKKEGKAAQFNPGLNSVLQASVFTLVSCILRLWVSAS